MTTFKKNLYSLLTIFVFVILALASKVDKLSTGSFNTGPMVEDKSDRRNYIIKNDGTKVYGKKIEWNLGTRVVESFNVAENLILDSVKYKSSDIKAFRKENVYFEKYKGRFLQRVLQGRINVYLYVKDYSDYKMAGVQPVHRIQVGEFADMIELKSYDQLKEIVSRCPAAYVMLNKSNSEIKAAIKENNSYINEVIEAYNKCN